VAFFVLDTRKHRTGPDVEEPSMLGGVQLAAFNQWLARVNNTAVFKFVATSVPFTSLWTHDAQIDSWAGYSQEKEQLLDAMHTVPNVILLSGDRHEFAAIEFASPAQGQYPVWEFSTSPLNMFYIPFFRTLQMQSNNTFQKTRTIINDGSSEVGHVKENIPVERVEKYLPDGNHKWSVLREA
jgi:alkaline phosphatase D